MGRKQMSIVYFFLPASLKIRIYPCTGSLPSPRNVAFRVEGVQAVLSRSGREVVMCGLWMLKVPANPIVHALHLLLLASLLLGTLTLTLGVNLSSKGAG